LDLRVSYGPHLDSGDRTIYYDLSNRNWEVVAITKEDWSIKQSTEIPIMFRRQQLQQPQTYPSSENQGYSDEIFDEFIDILNIRKDGNDRLLLKCYIISLFIPKISKAILMLHGPEGAAKSACQRLIKSLVDPSSTTLLRLKKKEEDLILKLAHNYLIYYDNVSEIPEWISDLLCMAATGTSFSKRMLYFDEEEVVFQLIRAIGFNGINLAASKADLLDRGLNIELEKIDETAILTFEKEILPRFDALKPKVLSYIFDIISKVLKLEAEGGIKLESRTRMADWEEYAEMISRCMGYEPMEFINAYKENRKTKSEVIIDETPVAEAVVSLMVLERLQMIANGNGGGTWWQEGLDEQELIWTGSPSQLLGLLNPIAADELKIDIQRNDLWPKAPHILTRRLKQVKSSLEGVGIFITKGQNHATKLRTIQIVKKEGDGVPPGGRKSSVSSASSASSENSRSNEVKNRDATGDATVVGSAIKAKSHKR
jgi:hypothetical protein